VRRMIAWSKLICGEGAMMRLLGRVVVLVVFLEMLAGAHGQLATRNITGKDIFSFHWIGDFDSSPDGRTVVFVQTNVAPEHDGYQTSLYLLDLTKVGVAPVLLTPGTHDGSPRWSPDGKQIAFVRAAEKDAKPSPAQLYVMAADPKASPIKLTDMPKGVSGEQWAPDGTALTALSSTPQDPAAAKLEAAKRARETGDAAHVSDVKIIDRATYKFNGEGYLDPTLVEQLYLVYLPKADGTQDAPWQLTGGRFGVDQYVWAAKAGWIFYSSTHVEEPVYQELRHNSIYGIAVTTSAGHAKDMPATGFTDDLKLEAAGLSLSPDGQHVAFHGSDEVKPISHQQDDLFVQDIDWAGGKPSVAGPPRNLTGKLAYEMGSGVGGDNTAPRGGARREIQWNAASTQMVDVAGYRGSALLVQVDASTGAVKELTAAKQAVIGFSATHDGEEMLALVSNPVMIGDLFKVGDGRAQTQLTHVNDALFSQLNLTMPLDIQVKPTVHASDIGDETIDTFIQLPPAGPQKNLPLILNIHGGPHSAYGWIFDHEMQWMAAQGYVVVYPNPRGSTTYGQNFANVIMNNYPGDDFHDLMDTVDAAVKLGYADHARMGVTGGSGGGLLTDWVVTQTDRFKAAVAQRDITDWADWWYTADMAGFFQSFYPKAPPFENVELYRAHSPITFVNNIKTPMMFILGEADYRTPPGAGGEQFFRALKYKKIPTVMVRFPRESHELSRSGEPWHRVERLENIVNWFDLYLKNICEPQYDVSPIAKPSCVAKP
jgi:dipeptidyl aminopeptidase/acylaminoacyl peptidase